MLLESLEKKALPANIYFSKSATETLENDIEHGLK